MLVKQIQQLFELLQTGERKNMLLAFELMKSQDMPYSILGFRRMLDINMTKGAHFPPSRPFHQNLAVFLRQRTFGLNPRQAWSSKINPRHAQVTELPKEMALLQAVYNIDINHCQLRTLPEEVGYMSKVEEITIRNSQLETLPEAVGQLKNLKFLIIKDNQQFTSLPENIGSLADSLKQLDLENNQLRELPESIRQLQQLHSLNLKGNPLPEVVVDQIRQALPNCTIQF